MRIKPEIIIHNATLTDVDRCERERELAYKMNAEETPLEDLLVALRLHYSMEGYDLTKIKDLSKLVETYSAVPVARNKAVVGTNAFAHESGIHVAAVLEEPGDGGRGHEYPHR